MLAFSTPSSPSRAFLMTNGHAPQVMPVILRLTLFVTAWTGAEAIIIAKDIAKMVRIIRDLFIFFLLLQE